MLWYQSSPEKTCLNAMSLGVLDSMPEYLRTRLCSCVNRLAMSSRSVWEILWVEKKLRPEIHQQLNEILTQTVSFHVSLLIGKSDPPLFPSLDSSPDPVADSGTTSAYVLRGLYSHPARMGVGVGSSCGSAWFASWASRKLFAKPKISDRFSDMSFIVGWCFSWFLKGQVWVWRGCFY